jgi:hypothetical protein
MSLNNTLGKNRYVFDGLDQLQNLLESTVLKSPCGRAARGALNFPESTVPDFDMTCSAPAIGRV